VPFKCRLTGIEAVAPLVDVIATVPWYVPDVFPSSCAFAQMVMAVNPVVTGEVPVDVKMFTP
jgi:hypothetical protein